MAPDNLETLGFREEEYKRVEHPNMSSEREKTGYIAGLGVKAYRK